MADAALESILQAIKTVQTDLATVKSGMVDKNGVKEAVAEQMLPIRQQVEANSVEVKLLVERVSALEQGQPAPKRVMLAAPSGTFAPPPASAASTTGSTLSSNMASGYAWSFKPSSTHVLHFKGDLRIDQSQALQSIQAILDRVNIGKDHWYLRGARSVSNSWTVCFKTPCGHYADGASAARDVRALAKNSSGGYDPAKFNRSTDNMPCTYSFWSDIDSSTMFRKFVFAEIKKLFSEKADLHPDVKCDSHDSEVRAGYDQVVKVVVRFGQHDYSLVFGEEQFIARTGIDKNDIIRRARLKAGQWRV